MKENTTFPDFLSHLKEIAVSPLAFAGYIFVIFFWAYYFWINRKNSIINSFKEDSGKLSALKELVNDSVPEGIDPITWYQLKLKSKKTNQLFLSFIATLLAVILLFTLYVFTAAESMPKGSKIIINSKNDSSNNSDSNSFNTHIKDSIANVNSGNKKSNNNNKSSFNTSK